MRVVVDTNVVAYFLLGNPLFEAETQEFWGGLREPIAPALWEAELTNVVWMSIRAGVLEAAEGLSKLHLARRLGIHTVATRALWHGALVRSVQTGVAVYDTLFVELAEREGVALATFDKTLLRSWPQIAQRPGDIHA